MNELKMPEEKCSTGILILSQHREQTLRDKINNAEEDEDLL